MTLGISLECWVLSFIYYALLVDLEATFIPEEEAKATLEDLVLADFVVLWWPVSLFGPGG